MKIAHVTSGVVRLLFVIVTAQPPLPAARPTVPRLFPVVTQKLTAPAVGGVVHAVVALYLTESAKYASSAVTRFRRSDFIEAMYAFAFVLARSEERRVGKEAISRWSTCSSKREEVFEVLCHVLC